MVPSEDTVKPDMKVGDYVCIHGKRMRQFHVPCRIVGEFVGQYQIYCSQGVVDTLFSGTELIPLVGCFLILLDEWHQAPKVSLRSMTNDPALFLQLPCYRVPDSIAVLFSI